MNYTRRGIINKQHALSSKGVKFKKMIWITILKALLICTISFIVIGSCMGIGMFKGIIAGAATDVYEKEPPLPLDHPLLNAPNCVCLPHIGYASREAFDIRADIVFDHVRNFLRK